MLSVLRGGPRRLHIFARFCDAEDPDAAVAMTD
jgi:hypothetical protein